jgi:hypothetical protein
MIPTCLLDDALQSLKSLFPTTVKLPSHLMANATQLKSCSDLGFDTWEDPLAFAWCDLGFCTGLDDVSTFWDMSHWRFKQMHLHAIGPNADAYRICASVTATYSVPVLLAATAAFAVCGVLAICLVSLLGPAISLIWQIIMFDHWD